MNRKVRVRLSQIIERFLLQGWWEAIFWPGDIKSDDVLFAILNNFLCNLIGLVVLAERAENLFNANCLAFGFCLRHTLAVSLSGCFDDLIER